MFHRFRWVLVGVTAFAVIVLGVSLFQWIFRHRAHYATVVLDSTGKRAAPYVSAAAVDTDGSVVISSGSSVHIAEALGDSQTPATRELDIPADTSIAGDASIHDISVSDEGQVWIEIGAGRAPVRTADATVHALADRLDDISDADAADVVPGAAPTVTRYAYAREIDDVAVVDEGTLLVATERASSPLAEDQNVLLHRIAEDGTLTLVAGRPGSGTGQHPTALEDRPRPATSLTGGATAPATDVDLDHVVAIQPLGGEDVLIATEAGRALAFFVVRNGSIERMDVQNTFVRRSGPAVITSRATDGRVVLNVDTGGSATDSRPAALLLDPASGHTVLLRDDLLFEEDLTGPDSNTEVLIANGDDPDHLLDVVPASSERDDDHAYDYVRLAEFDLPSTD